jgi:hypothetical protein
MARDRGGGSTLPPPDNAPATAPAEPAGAPLTYRIEHCAGDTVVEIAHGLSYIGALRRVAALVHVAEPHASGACLRIVEEAFGTTVFAHPRAKKR